MVVAFVSLQCCFLVVYGVVGDLPDYYTHDIYNAQSAYTESNDKSDKTRFLEEKKTREDSLIDDNNHCENWKS